MPNKNILLIEPGYKNKYPPLSLMKIASYHGPWGKKDNVRFIKGETDKTVFETVWDRIYVTTLFSFEWKTISRSIDFADELYADDRTSAPIEDLIPDYSILDQIQRQYIYPVHDAYFAYASRGCVRTCHFCGVPKLEGNQRDVASLTSIVRGIEERYG